MKWFSKNPPIYIFDSDTWERETDHKIFHQAVNNWVGHDGEMVPYPKKVVFCKLKSTAS